MTTQIRKQLLVNRIGMSALQQVCGISPSDLQQSMFAHMGDLDKQDIYREHQIKTMPQDAKARVLSKERVLSAVRFLQDKMLDAYQESINETKNELDASISRNEPVDNDEQEDKMQVRVQIAMAMARDELFFKEDINEADIELTINELDLNDDAEYIKIMRESQERFDQ